MIISLSGTNSYLLKKRLDQLAGEFIKQHGNLAVERIDGVEAEPATVLEAVQSLPFLAVRKLVILRQPLANKALAEQLEQIISSTGNSTDLIIVEPSPDKRTAAYKLLKSATQLEEFTDMKEPELASWLVSEATQSGYELDRASAIYLVERVGLDQAVLASELVKLGLYDPHITRHTIDQLTDKSPQSKVFDLLDAAFAGRKPAALKLYDEQRAQKIEPQNILALITWQLHLIMLAKFGKGKTAAVLARDAQMNPYPLQKAQALADKLTLEQLRQMVSQAAQIDYKSKRSAIDLDEALRAYLVSL